MGTDIKDIYKQIKNEYEVDSLKIIAGGISAGAMAATNIALNNAILLKGLILFCPVKPREMDEMVSAYVKKSDLKVFIVTGENDNMLPVQNEMVDKWNELGIVNKYIILKDSGHQYPDEETKYIDQALDFILN